MKRPVFARLFRWIARRRAARFLDGVHVSGLVATRAMLERGPVLLASTHVASWDPLLMLLLEPCLGMDGYALMDSENLRRLRFFSWLGAIGLDRSRASAVRRDLRAAAALLDRPGRAVVIFPQGRQRPPRRGPLDLQPGVHLLARAAKVPVIPVAIDYLFREADRPAAMIHLGAPLPPGGPREAWMTELERRLVAGLDEVAHFAESGEGGFATLVAPRGGRQEDALPTRALAGIARRLETS